jgi:outer membrane lipoprotein-sorting protein
MSERARARRPTGRRARPHLSHATKSMARPAAALPAPRPLLALNLLLALLALGLLALSPGRAAGAALPDGQALLKEVDSVLQPESFESYRKLVDTEPDGSRKEWLLYTVKKGQDKVLALFLTPASDKGRSTLRLGDNMWLYIPSVAKPIRITSLQSVTGGVFNNADILRLDFSVEYRAETVEDAGKEYLLSLKARTDAVAYDRLKMWVDKQHRLPTRIECYAASGLLIKTLYYSAIKDLGDGVPRPSVVQTDSPLHKGYKSALIWAKLKPRKLDDEVFTLSFMSRVEELR